MCPIRCSCSWKESKNVIICDRQNLTEVQKIVEDPSSEEQIYNSASFNDNNLKKLNELKLLGYKDIQDLSFQRCSIKTISKEIFKDLSNLRTLDLSQNKISTIDVEAFSGLSRLTELDLSQNDLWDISSKVFISLTQLVFLDLSKNDLQRLQIHDLGAIESRRTLTKLTKLNLEENPWKCECELGRFYNALRNRKISTNAKCNNETLWTTLTPENFTCIPNLLTKTSLQNVQVGENKTLKCTFEANPTPNVLWKYEGIKLEDGYIQSVTKSRPYNEIGLVQMILELYDISEATVGDYTCHAFNDVGENKGVIHVSLANALKVSNLKTVEIAVGVCVSLLILLGVTGSVLCYCRHRKKVAAEGNVSSFSILNNTNSLPPMKKEDLNVPWTNPVPKPPRIGLYNSNNNVVTGVDLNSSTLRSSLNMPGIAAVPYNHERFLSHYISNQYLSHFPPAQYQSPQMRVNDNLEMENPELLHWLHQRPGSRASIGTVSTMVSSYNSDYPASALAMSHHPPSLVRNQTHPPQQQTRPGYVTLPRKPKTRPLSPFIPLDSLGPRTSADGSSFHNISTMMTSPPNDKLSLPHMQFVANDNTQANVKDEPVDDSLKENDDFSLMTRNEDSPPNTSRQILDTIPEQD